jgi:hypothetical protein
MDADSIAWHRTRLKIDRETLADYESGKVTIGEIVGSKKVDQTNHAIVDLKRKIAQHEQIIAAYEKHSAKGKP